jgi:hypothetical protein
MTRSAHEKAFLELVRDSDDPSDVERERVRYALAVKLGGIGTILQGGAAKPPSSAALPGAGTKVAIVASLGGTLGKIAAGLAIVSLSLGALAVHHSSGASSARKRVMTVATSATTPEARERDDNTAAVEPFLGEASNSAIRDLPVGIAQAQPEKAPPSDIEPRRTQVTRASASMKSAGESDLLEETHLITKSDQALQRGNAAEALTLLDEHARRFPAGVLQEERTFERITALCMLGRAPEARGEAERFLREYPDTPLSTKTRGLCAKTLSNDVAPDSAISH